VVTTLNVRVREKTHTARYAINKLRTKEFRETVREGLVHKKLIIFLTIKGGEFKAKPIGKLPEAIDAAVTSLQSTIRTALEAHCPLTRLFPLTKKI